MTKLHELSYIHSLSQGLTLQLGPLWHHCSTDRTSSENIEGSGSSRASNSEVCTSFGVDQRQSALASSCTANKIQDPATGRKLHRVVHGSDGPAGRVGSGRVGSRFCRILAGRVGSGQPFGFLSSSLIISWYQNRYESSNTAFGLTDFLRYLYIIIK